MAESISTVVVADDDEPVRLALADLISDHPRLLLVGIAASGGETADLCRLHHPHLAVVDFMMPGGGVDAIEAIRNASPATSVVVYTAQSNRRTREHLLRAGAADVVIKGGERELDEALLHVIES